MYYIRIRIVNISIRIKYNWSIFFRKDRDWTLQKN